MTATVYTSHPKYKANLRAFLSPFHTCGLTLRVVTALPPIPHRLQGFKGGAEDGGVLISEPRYRLCFVTNVALCIPLQQKCLQNASLFASKLFTLSLCWSTDEFTGHNLKRYVRHARRNVANRRTVNVRYDAIPED